MTDITSFASAHGFRIHPRVAKGYGSIDDFVSQTSGMCPSVSGRRCPCEESLAELASPDPLDQHCTGFVLVTQAYIKEVDPRGKLYGDVPEPVTSTPVSDEVSAVVSGYIPGIDAAINHFKKGKYEEAVDELFKLADETECDVCREQFLTEAIHANNARNLCELPYEGGCKEEIVRVGSRLGKMRNFFSQAAGVDNGDSQPVKKSGSSPYREAMAEWLNSEELKPYEQKVRFFMASQLAGSKCSTVDEAMEAAIAAHPDWFS